MYISSIFRRVALFSASVVLAANCVQALAQQQGIDRVVVFGGSLSDTGNSFVFLSDPVNQSCGARQNVPPYDKLDDLLVPDSIADVSATALPGGPLEPSITVLVADDYDINRHVLRALLEQRGHRVLEAEDGLQAMEIVSRMRPDLVLMDVDMPHLDGLESTRRIRAMGGFEATVPIYALSGKTFPEDIGRVAASGMNGHLCKPVELHDLVAVLRQAPKERPTAPAKVAAAAS